MNAQAGDDPMTAAGADARSVAPHRAERVTRLLALAVSVGVTAAYAAAAVSRRWMDDDGFINLRIVRNIVEGHGPVYNVGERVEAGTSPLWLALVAALRAAGIRLEYAAVYLGIALAVAGVFLMQRADEPSAPRRPGTFSIPLPLGALVVIAIPAYWDYASSGLETGLTFGWLGGAYFLLARHLTRHASDPPPNARVDRATAGVAAVCGLGPLVRPELALYSAAFLLPLVAALPARPTWRALARRAVTVAGCALAVPLAFQLFRMGYYGLLTPNTAVAKEAFRPHWAQGTCYAANFFGVYRLYAPLAALGLVALLKARDLVLSRAWPRVLATLSLPVVAILHGTYVVAMGGDYMHARMFLPALFAAVLPVATIFVEIEPRALRSSLRSAFLPIALTLPVGVWAVICASSLRVPRENVCGIGDERGWYSREAGVTTPIVLDEFRRHPFFKAGIDVEAGIRKNCPRGAGTKTGCRVIVVDAGDREVGYAQRDAYPLAPEVDARIDAAAPLRAIGMTGFYLPSSVQVVDRHALTDGIGSHLIADERRTRPGHEKMITNPWLFARFGAASPDEEPSITAARRALTCGALGSLARGSSAPLTAGVFLHNLVNAPAHQRVRIPADPFEAEEAFCNLPPYRVSIAGGTGGWTFHARCRQDLVPVGLRGSLADDDKAIAEAGLVCADPQQPDARVPGAVYGEAKDHKFDLECPAGQVMVGLRGLADNLLRQVALDCAPPGGVASPTPAVGSEKGTAFALGCSGVAPLGIVGRSGSLVDALGVECR